MKNIALCIDGTNYDSSGGESNVLKIFQCLLKSWDKQNKDAEQLTYYDSGVETLINPGLIGDMRRKVGKLLDMGCGYRPDDQVCRAYRFIVEYYEEGDQIFLFGFSRGAYSCRALAGMIHSVGLINSRDIHLTDSAWTHYSQCNTPKDFKAAANFKKIFGRKIGEKRPICLVGVFDTVSSFGTIADFKTLPFTSKNPSICHVRHAVAADENRACFQANLFDGKKVKKRHESFQELWFAGCHRDVGGGNEEKYSSLSKITLQWMLNEANKLGCKFSQKQIAFFLGQSAEGHKKKQVQPDPLGPVNPSMKGLCNLLEFLPRHFWTEDEQSVWRAPNLYKSRDIPETAKFHQSLDEKLQRDKAYQPRNLSSDNKPSERTNKTIKMPSSLRGINCPNWGGFVSACAAASQLHTSHICFFLIYIVVCYIITNDPTVKHTPVVVRSVPGGTSDSVPSCIRNGDFEIGTDGWDAVNSENGYIVPGIGGPGNNYALQVSGREHQDSSGPGFDIDTRCLTPGNWYEVSADVKLTEAESDAESDAEYPESDPESESIFECNPTSMGYNSQSCAGINLVMGSTIKQIAYTVAPLSNNDGWNKMNGVFKATKAMVAESTIYLLVARAPKEVYITIDNVLLSSAGAEVVGVTNCSHPLSNGDAEIGDARGWLLQSEHGSVEMSSPGYGGIGYAFKHVGSRFNRLSSMVQLMDGSCFNSGSTWTITAQFRVYDINGSFVSCTKDNLNSADACPVFAFFAGDYSTGTVHNTGALNNLDDSMVEVGGWNRIENTFTVATDMASQVEMWINICAPVAFNYEIDEIKVQGLDSQIDGLLSRIDRMLARFKKTDAERANI